MFIIQEFKAFAMRGNVVDLAVGVVIGAAFGKIVSSMVENIFMPLLGMATCGVAFKDPRFTLGAAVRTCPAVGIGYRQFVSTCIDFIIIAFATVMVVKLMSRFMADPPTAPKGHSQEELLTQIRDHLKKKKEPRPDNSPKG